MVSSNRIQDAIHKERKRAFSWVLEKECKMVISNKCSIIRRYAAPTIRMNKMMHNTKDTTKRLHTAAGRGICNTCLGSSEIYKAVHDSMR